MTAYRIRHMFALGIINEFRSASSQRIYKKIVSEFVGKISSQRITSEGAPNSNCILKTKSEIIRKIRFRLRTEAGAKLKSS